MEHKNISLRLLFAFFCDISYLNGVYICVYTNLCSLLDCCQEGLNSSWPHRDLKVSSDKVLKTERHFPATEHTVYMVLSIELVAPKQVERFRWDKALFSLSMYLPFLATVNQETTYLSFTLMGKHIHLKIMPFKYCKL